MPLLKKDVDEGRLMIVFKDFIFLGRDSRTLASAAECVYRKYDTDKFLEYHMLTYMNQGFKNSGWGSDENILDFASQLSWLDTTYLKECLLNNTYLPIVIDDTYAGMLAGVSSTPTFVIGDQLVSGALTYSVFKEIMENSKEDLSLLKSDSITTG